MPEKTDYDPVWGRIEESVDRVLAAGETSLSRVLRLVEAEWRRLDAGPTDGTAYGQTVRLPRAALYGGREGIRMRVAIDACREDTQLVVELGSGWGNNLLNLYLFGGPQVPYYSLELTRSGRAVADRLAALEPSLDLTTLPFDFLDARYDEVPRVDGHVLVFSSHAIEQIPVLPEDAITGLFGLGRSVTGVHFEPVGWQVHGGRGRKYAERENYNRNLWELLQGLEQRGELTIETVEPDIYGHKTNNVSTLIVWRR